VTGTSAGEGDRLPFPVFFLDGTKLVLWIGVALMVYGVSLVLGVLIARVIELVLGGMS
jgi:hypothetical protein